MSTVSPFMLANRRLRSLVVKNLRICHFSALAGLLAYQVTDPVFRLFIVGFAVWMSCLSWAATWYSEGGQPGRLESKISAWTIGLIASSVVKFAWQTSNPIWPTTHASNGGWNGIGLILATKFVAGMGIFRTLTCGGWTYVTSTDDHDWHDIFMISYLVATLPWTLGCLALSPANAKAVKYRKYLASAFFGTLVPLIYFFIQHKVHKVAGGMSVDHPICGKH